MYSERRLEQMNGYAKYADVRDLQSLTRLRFEEEPINAFGEVHAPNDEPDIWFNALRAALCIRAFFQSVDASKAPTVVALVEELEDMLNAEIERCYQLSKGETK
jgi:hypothetical protein